MMTLRRCWAQPDEIASNKSETVRVSFPCFIAARYRHTFFTAYGRRCARSPIPDRSANESWGRHTLTRKHGLPEFQIIQFSPLELQLEGKLNQARTVHRLRNLA